MPTDDDNKPEHAPFNIDWSGLDAAMREMGAKEVEGYAAGRAGFRAAAARCKPEAEAAPPVRGKVQGRKPRLR